MSLDKQVKHCFNDKTRICGPDCPLFFENIDDKGRVLNVECALASIRWLSITAAEIGETLDHLADVIDEALKVAPGGG